MNVAAIYHRSTDAFCYSPDGRSLIIRIQTASDDIESVEVWVGDPYEWRVNQESMQAVWQCVRIKANRIGSNGLSDYWEARWVPPYKRARYAFRLYGRDGSVCDLGEKGLVRIDPADRDKPIDYWNSFLFPYIHQTDTFRAPAWVASTVWYQIFPERFRNGNPNNDPPGTKPWSRGAVQNREFYGGDIEGIIQGLDHIEALGCNGIYLTPVFSSPSAHKYDTTDYFRIDPSFGTEEDLKRLVDVCKAKGIRIILDAVFNHAGKEFGPWKDLVERGSDSIYRDWFRIRDFPLFPSGQDSGDSRHTNFETFGFTTRMPKLNTNNPETREYLLEVAVKYVRDFGIDGWRLDVANEIDHEFWREFRKRVKAVNPDAYIVGEIWHDAMPWLRGDQHDAVMNYPFGSAITDFVLGNAWAPTGKDFLHRINAISFSYPDMVLQSTFNLLDSHDTDRIVTRFQDRELAKIALCLLFALPGSPCLYYGTEYALEGGRDPDCRRCMIWDPQPDEKEFERFVTSLVNLRRTWWKTFAYGARESFFNDNFPGFVALIIHDNAMRLALLVNRDTSAVPEAAWRDALGLHASVPVEVLLAAQPFAGFLGGRSAVYLHM